MWRYKPHPPRLITATIPPFENQNTKNARERNFGF